MSRTLFWYILKDLLRVFLMTAGGLAGIMSFGGLLRPLTEHGLDAGQVGKMLTYFMPAMMTYSLPVAALFATSVVYGRLAADNEITAMRATGISYSPLGGIATPALVLGLGVAITSLLFLCFLVPTASLRVERVIYSNLAQLIANQIHRTHQIKYADHTIYAQDAVVAAPDPARPNEQVVTLGGIMIVTYGNGGGREKVQLPAEFFLARRATLLIHGGRRAEDEYSLEVRLDGGTTFPREFTGGIQGGLQTTQFGPIPIPSPIKEKTDFMDIRRLHELYADRTKSRQVRSVLQRLIRAEQSAEFLEDVRAALSGRGGAYRFDAGTEVFELRPARRAEVRVRKGKLEIVGGATLVEERQGRPTFEADASHVVVTARPTADERLAVTVELHGAIVKTDDDPTPRTTPVARPFVVDMPQEVAALSARRPEHYLTAAGVASDDRMMLRRELIRLGNGIHSELHARASFAVSCLILVIVGCALGMMFRSGNFLTAFAVSVVPALLCIALIITGQHTCENVPWKMENFTNSQLNFGLSLIWSGNAAVAVIATALLWRLHRQ